LTEELKISLPYFSSQSFLTIWLSGHEW
jgi:hypothetical protein